MSPLPRISVIVPTRNRAHRLGACLTSLLSQTLASDAYEICVVDNGSTDETPQVIADMARQYGHRQFFSVTEPLPGVSRARNLGIRSTLAPLIAFADDDVVTPPDWLERYVARFDQLPPETAKIGGELDPLWEIPRPDWVSEAMLCLLSARSSLKSAEARFCKPGAGETLIECNCCYRREALVRVGSFPVDLGRKNDSLLSGENALDYRLVVEGAGFFYDPGIRVGHVIPGDRLTPEWFKRRYFWQGVTDYAVRIYLERHGVAIPASHAISIPASPSDWETIVGKTTAHFDDTLRKIRGAGFMMAMAGAIDL